MPERHFRPLGFVGKKTLQLSDARLQREIEVVTILAKRLAQLCPVVPHVCSALRGLLVEVAELILGVVPPTSRMRYLLFPCTKEWSLLVLLNRRPFHLLLEAYKVVSGEILVEHGDGNAVVAL